MELSSARRKGDTPEPQAPAALEADGLKSVGARRSPWPDGSTVRRALDVFVAVHLMALAAPFLAIGMAAVWWSGGRPIFFGHERVGRGGRPFLCWKLRTMETGAEARLEEDAELKRRYLEDGFKLPDRDDPRLLAGTGWLRRSHVDELPQLLNVLKGDMSLVGPRPLVKDEVALYGEGRWALLSRRPGITGAWAALGANRPPYPERAEIELEYMRRANLRVDLMILLRTARVVLGRWTRG